MNYSSLDDSETPIKLLLIGPNGGGKTFKAAQLPRPVILNFDNNLSGLRKLPEAVRRGLKIVNPRMTESGKEINDPKQLWQNLVKILEAVTEDTTIDNIVIDSLTTFSELIFDKIVGATGLEAKVEIQHYYEFGRHLKWLGDEYLNSPMLKQNVIFLAHEEVREHKATKEWQGTLYLPSKQRDMFGLYFTDCWRVFAKPGADKPKYMVRTLPSGSYPALKCSLPLPTEFEWDTQMTEVQKFFTRKG